MATATPENLVDVIAQVMSEALAALADAPGQVADQLADTWAQLEQLEKDVLEIPGDVLGRLKQLVNPPDLKSLLILVLLQVAELDRDHLSMVALRDRDEHEANGIGLRYAVTDPVPASLTAGIFFSGQARPRAFQVAVTGAINTSIPQGEADLKVLLRSDQANVTWHIALDHVQPPAQVAALTLGLTKQLRPTELNGTGATIIVGPMAAQIRLSTHAGEPLWSARASVGDVEQVAGSRPGLGIAFAPEQLLGALAGNIQVALPSAQVSPLAVLEAGRPPQFDLRQKVG